MSSPFLLIRLRYYTYIAVVCADVMVDEAGSLEVVVVNDIVEAVDVADCVVDVVVLVNTGLVDVDVGAPAPLSSTWSPRNLKLSPCPGGIFTRIV